MKEIYKNEILLTQELNDEYAKASYRKYRWKYRIGLGIFAALDIAAGIGVMFVYGQYLIGALFLLLGAGVGILSLQGYVGGSQKAYNNLKALYKGTPRLFANFYEDHFERNTSQNTITVEYEQVTDIMETPNLYGIMVGRQGAIQQGIILCKTGFKTGDAQTFLAFMQKKCPNMKSR